ncbi:arsenical-resistance protein [Pseudogymnoascus sp. 03VT05]|nr:arsenical-resistance protein [Pseudogymnoascus sp. 03VT05]
MSVNDTEPANQETTKRHSKVDELPSDTEKNPPITIDKDAEEQPTADSENSRHFPKESAFKSLGLLDRFLAVWIFLAMAMPALQKGTFVGVSIPIAVGLLVMMYPILCKVQFETLHHVFREREVWIQILFSIVLNWIIAPLLMLALSWAFLPDKPSLREGLILVGIARCTAMVLIWTSLAGGSTSYCAILVAINSLLQMVLFAPLAILYITIISRGTSSHISYATAAQSVAVFFGIPLGFAILTRLVLRRVCGAKWYEGVFIRLISPLSLLGLLFTILVLFASQGRNVVHQIVSVVRVAAPLIVYFALIFFLTLLACYKLGFGYKLATTQAFTAASNNFELAIAVAVAAFGPDSEQALAATVGPLVEVPVLLGLVYVVKWVGRRRGWKD